MVTAVDGPRPTVSVRTEAPQSERLMTKRRSLPSIAPPGRSFTPIETRHYRDVPLRAMVAAKRDQGLVVSVCIPAHNEEDTVAKVVTRIRRYLVDRLALVDEVLVLDDHSVDGTAKVAAAAGARVVQARDVLADVAGGGGKGEALWRSLYVARGDIVLWCDADITDFGSRFVVGLLGPLLVDPAVSFVKGFYERPVADGSSGGRTTELMARPVLATLFPHLSTIMQPLSGEFGGRRTLLEQLPFVRGYGVDIGLLIDTAEAVGPHGIVQVDLGTRVHRNRPLDELGPQALTVLQTALDRAGVRAANPATLLRPAHPPLVRAFAELPPLVTLPAGDPEDDERPRAPLPA
ncbi:MAG TPA: glucosyl-3-phosphoglycerate synthase [Acidimicrobiales bacterium]|nr:glucosyl-3-phosphoglycerate synthase [Acidimicrobiales bacterium]